MSYLASASGLPLGKSSMHGDQKWIALHAEGKAGLGQQEADWGQGGRLVTRLLPRVDFLYAQRPDVRTSCVTVLQVHSWLCPLQGRTPLLRHPEPSVYAH